MRAVTQWFKASQRPQRAGVYQRILVSTEIINFSFWDGSFWGPLCETEKDASCCIGARSLFQNLRWRGLSEKPED